MGQFDFLQFLTDIPGVVVAVPMLLLLCAAVAGKARRRKSAPSLSRTLRIINQAPVRATPVLNKSEQSLHAALSEIVGQSRTHRLLVQVSMGEFLRLEGRGSSRSKWQTVFNVYNAKRVDFLIVGADWTPRVVIEYQGRGHYKGNARARDAIKRAVCDRADVAFMEVASEGLNAAQIRELCNMLGTSSFRASA
mmetsp:Transcript_4142/g.7499  ORF Transcript_4142/g.7499 Transcript_4142/m.7499 type:complete len:193 (+) Transcript_4142:393-971(+)